MTGYKPRVVSITKRPGQTFGFFLRVEHGEEGHLVRSLEMGGPAELAGMKDGDRILRVNGTFVDGVPHSEVVEMVRNSGVSVAFHILDEASYKQAKAQGVNLCGPQNTPVTNGVAKPGPKPKLCYLLKSSSESSYGFSLRSVKGQQGVFMAEVVPGGVAERAGVKINDRLLEVNGENIESYAHEQVVDKLKQVDSGLMFLLVDQETDKDYRGKNIKPTAGSATVMFLPFKPRIIDLTKGSDGYGFLLREEPNQAGHIIKDVDRGSPADRGGLKDMDRLVAVDGKAVDSCSHEEVVDRIRKSGNNCCLLVVDKETDQMYKQGNVSPMLFLEEKKKFSPPSYTEAITLPQVQPPTRGHDREEELKPKLCKMIKTTGGYGFHLNGVQGVYGQHIKEVVKGGVADRAGLEDNDIVVEVNGRNVEQSTHEEVVAMIRSSGDSLEMLVAKKSVYDQLKAKGVTITRLLLGETSEAQVHTANIPVTSMELRREDRSRPETPEPARERSSSVSSHSSCDSFDQRF